jgi:hypothetical protein
MALVVDAAAFARAREGLAGTAPGPDFSVFGPAGEFKGKVPPPDPGKEMGASNPGKIGPSDFLDASLIYNPLRYFTSCSQIAKPLCGVGVKLVIENHFGPWLARRFLMFCRSFFVSLLFYM